MPGTRFLRASAPDALLVIALAALVGSIAAAAAGIPDLDVAPRARYASASVAREQALFVTNTRSMPCPCGAAVAREVIPSPFRGQPLELSDGDTVRWESVKPITRSRGERLATADNQRDFLLRTAALLRQGAPTGPVDPWALKRSTDEAKQRHGLSTD